MIQYVILFVIFACIVFTMIVVCLFIARKTMLILTVVPDIVTNLNVHCTRTNQITKYNESSRHETHRKHNTPACEQAGIVGTEIGGVGRSLVSRRKICVDSTAGASPRPTKNLCQSYKQKHTAKHTAAKSADFFMPFWCVKNTPNHKNTQKDTKRHKKTPTPPKGCRCLKSLCYAVFDYLK